MGSKTMCKLHMTYRYTTNNLLYCRYLVMSEVRGTAQRILNIEFTFISSDYTNLTHFMSHTHTHTLGTWQHWATLELHWQYRLMAYVQSKHSTFDQDLISLVQCVHFGIMWLLDWATGKVLNHITTPYLTKRDHRLLDNDMNEQKWN